MNTMKAKVGEVFRGKYDKRIVRGQRRTKTIESGFLKTRPAALLWAEVVSARDDVSKVVRGSSRVVGYDAVVIGEKRPRFFLVEEQFTVLPSFVADVKSTESRRIAASSKGRYYIETVKKSFSKIRLWNGKGKQPECSMVLIGPIYYRLGPEISVE